MFEPPEFDPNSKAKLVAITFDEASIARGNANIEMAGEWQAQITYDGPRGRGRASFPVTAQ